MNKQDIFNSFIKVAKEKGLISEDAPEKAKKALEKNPRWDSLTTKDIEKLYNVKPNSIKSMEYKKNISELAHPDLAVVSPAHDKLNGLVESINQRQNILLHIVNKPVNGLNTQHKYAHDLAKALVRVGNDLSNKKNADLAKLADACLIQLSGNFNKKAAAPALLIVPVLLGALYFQQHIGFANEGFEVNHNKLIAEIDDLINSNSNFGVGYKYKPEFIRTLNEFKSKLVAFHSLYKKNESVITDLEKPKTAQELLQISQEPNTNTVVQAFNTIKSAAANMLPFITSIQKSFSNEEYKNRQIEEKGMISSLLDKTQLHGGHGLVADDFDDVARAITPYLQSIKQITDLLNNAGSVQAKAQSELQEASTKTDEMFNPPKDKIDLDNDAQSLEKELSTII